MKKLIKNLVLLFVLFLGFHGEVYAGKLCTVCAGDVPDALVYRHQALSCARGHRIDQECLTHQVKSHENLNQMQSQGLSCCGMGCGHKFPLAEVMAILEPSEQVALQTRIYRAGRPVDESKSKEQLSRLKLGITESFVVQCPAEGCGAACDRIEGCNAAQCQNEECGNRFCYLCLESQGDSATGHAHALAHSNNYWEQRPGYLGRYHWLLARKNLAALLRSKVEDSTRKQALLENQALLEEKKMWPMPAGLATSVWLEQVRSNADLAPVAKIELLQNEAIYRRQVNDKKNGELIEAEILRLGGPVLASLDVKDAPPDIVAVLEGHPRFNELSLNFRALGHPYEAAGLIWSGPAPVSMTQQNAVEYCAGLGGSSRLPTQAEFIALSRTMGSQQPVYGAPNYDVNGYNRNLIPMSQKTFWSASVYPTDNSFAANFIGYSGRIGKGYVHHPASVRCVW